MISEEQVKDNILNLFKKEQIKQNGIISPNSINNYLLTIKDSNVMNNAIDDLIMRGLILEVRSDGKITYKLTKHGYEYIHK